LPTIQKPFRIWALFLLLFAGTGAVLFALVAFTVWAKERDLREIFGWILFIGLISGGLAFVLLIPIALLFQTFYGVMLGLMGLTS